MNVCNKILFYHLRRATVTNFWFVCTSSPPLSILVQHLGERKKPAATNEGLKIRYECPLLPLLRNSSRRLWPAGVRNRKEWSRAVLLEHDFCRLPPAPLHKHWGRPCPASNSLQSLWGISVCYNTGSLREAKMTYLDLDMLEELPTLDTCSA